MGKQIHLRLVRAGTPVSPTDRHVAAGLFHAPGQVRQSLCRLGAGVQLVVVEGVVLSVAPGGQIGHDHVGTSQDAQLPPAFADGAKGGGGGQKDVRQHEPQKTQHVQSQLQSTRLFPGEGRVPVGDEGADAYHVGPELLEKEHILGQMPGLLEGGAHHEAGPHLVADGLQVQETGLPVRGAQRRRMELCVVVAAAGLMAQQVAVRSGVKKGLVGIVPPLADGEGQRAVRKSGLDAPDETDHPLVCEPAILPALEHKGAKSQLIALAAAVQDLVLGQPVALDVRVALSDAAVVAVVPAVVGELDESPDVDILPVDGLPHLPGQSEEMLRRLRGAPVNDPDPLLPGEGPLPVQFVDQCLSVHNPPVCPLRHKNSLHPKAQTKKV